MRLQSLTVACLVAVCAARAEALDIKPVAGQKVLTVEVASVSEFPAAYDKLAQYCRGTDGLCPTLPRISLGNLERMLAAVQFHGAPHETADVHVYELPPATVATRVHVGPYWQLPWSVRELIDAAEQAGYAPDKNNMLRLVHKNSPEDSPSSDLITEIQLPIVKR